MKNTKTILSLGIPSIAAFASMTVTGMINLIMVGQLGAVAIAIVGVSNVIMYNAWALFSGIGNTVNYLVAQKYGSKNMRMGLERTYIALLFSLTAGIFTLLAGIFGAAWILKVMGNSTDIINGGTHY